MQQTVSIAKLLVGSLGFLDDDNVDINLIVSPVKGVGKFRLKILRKDSSTETVLDVSFIYTPIGEIYRSPSPAPAAAFFNEKYFLETLKAKSVKLEVARILGSAVVDDNGKRYPVVITRPINRNAYQGGKRTLGIEELKQVATFIARLQSAFRQTDHNCVRIVNENFSLIYTPFLDHLISNANSYLDELYRDYNGLFTNFQRTSDLIRSILKSPEILRDMHQFAMSSAESFALCHGFLTSDDVIFGDHHEIVEIRNWENVHYGCSVEDLAYIIITSATPRIRRNYSLSIIRSYYYCLVDMRCTTDALTVLREIYNEMHKYVVITSLPRLVSMLRVSDRGDECSNAELIERWETAVEDIAYYDGVETDDGQTYE
ncbi:hypothetical protein AB6A40_004035 [Gnathostoma spinigerum]|uniref:Aminoglycoside phosphotransferase domain-containing protein n=1 Tax=Gnathostoma spinigerum TaxID=75299 RepID=A0ABD6EDN3_9BILA